MCRQLAAATGLSLSYSNHILSATEDLTLKELDEIAHSLDVDITEIIKSAETERSVLPYNATSPSSGVKLQFYLPADLFRPTSNEDKYLWISGRNFPPNILPSQTLIFDAAPTATFVEGKYYISHQDETFDVVLCVRTNPFFSSFVFFDDHEVVKVAKSPNPALASSEGLTIHTLACAISNYFHADSYN